MLYQFSARGHDVAQAILGSLLDHPHDAASAYYRSRPLLLSLGLSIEDALGSPLGRSGGFSDGRDIGVVCNLPNRDGPIVLPMSGDVGSQYTPCAGWAQSIRYHTDVLGDDSWKGAIGVVLGGEGSVATNGFWSALTMATTLSLPMLFYVEDNGLGISVRGEMQTPGANIARNLASFDNLFIRDGDGTDPAESAKLLGECVAHVRGGGGPALVRLTVPRLSQPLGAGQSARLSHRRGDRGRRRARPAAAAPRASRSVAVERGGVERARGRSRARRASGARRRARAAESGSGERRAVGLRRRLAWLA